MYWEQIRKKFEDEHCCKPEHWMMTEYDGRVKDYWRFPTGKKPVKITPDEDLEDDV